MSKRAKKQSPAKDKAHQPPQPLPPVDIVDGIPDRAENPPKWKYFALAGIFAAWVAFLVYCHVAGGPTL